MFFDFCLRICGGRREDLVKESRGGVKTVDCYILGGGGEHTVDILFDHVLVEIQKEKV